MIGDRDSQPGLFRNARIQISSTLSTPIAACRTDDRFQPLINEERIEEENCLDALKPQSMQSYIFFLIYINLFKIKMDFLKLGINSRIFRDFPSF